MKKAISLILAITLVITAFSSLFVSGDTVPDSGETIISNAVTPSGNNVSVSLESWSSNTTGYQPYVETVYDLPTAGVHSGISINNGVPIGVGPNTGVYNINLMPGTYINPQNNIFLMYVRFPEWSSSANAPDRYWCTETVRFLTMGVKQNGTEYHTRLKNSVIYYLGKDASEWKTGTLSDADTAVNTGLNGFEGYLAIDVSTVANYSSWSSSGFDSASEYQISYISFNNSQLGGVCGDFAIGGFYGADSFSPSSLEAVYKLTGKSCRLTSYDGNAISVRLLIDDDGTEDKIIKNNVWLGNDDKWEGVASQTVIEAGEAVCPAGTQKSIRITSPAEEGYHNSYSTATYQQIEMNTKVKCTEGSTALLLYLELPENSNGESSLRIASCTYDGYKYQSFSNRADAYDYLETDSSEWVTGCDTDDNNQLTFPNGFKGFVKIYLDGGADLWKMSFCFGAYGGAYGDVIIGGVWDVVNNTDSVNMRADGVQFAMTNPIITAEREAPAYLDYNGISLGGTPSRVSLLSGSDTSGLSWKYSKTEEPIRGNNAIELIGMALDGAVAEGELTAADAPVARLTAWGKIKPSIDTFMIYVELPTNAAGADWSIAFDAFAVSQNNNIYYSGGENMLYSYLGITDTEWTYTMTDSNEHALLPSGFKGYIKFDVTAMPNFKIWMSDSENYPSPLDMDAQYSLDSIDFRLAAVGGEYGSFKIGGMYNITSDSDTSIYAKTKDWVYTSYIKDCLSLYENDEQALIGTMRELLEDIGTVNIEDSENVSELEKTIYLMSDDVKSLLTDDELAAIAEVTEQFSAYRPEFLGVAARMPDGIDKAGIKVGANADLAAAAEEGYSPVEYGTVMLKDIYYSDDEWFTADSYGAELAAGSNTEDGVTSIKWDAVYESNNWTEYAHDIYFRSYIVYYNGENYITVWNKYYENTSIIQGDLDISVTESLQPYLCTSIARAANNFGFSVFEGHAYGNVNGDHLIDSSDLAVLQKYLMGSGSIKYIYTADTTGDSSVDVRDLIRLKKYLADNSVKMGPETESCFILR